MMQRNHPITQGVVPCSCLQFRRRTCRRERLRIKCPTCANRPWEELNHQKKTDCPDQKGPARRFNQTAALSPAPWGAPKESCGQDEHADCYVDHRSSRTTLRRRDDCEAYAQKAERGTPAARQEQISLCAQSYSKYQTTI